MTGIEVAAWCCGSFTLGMALMGSLALRLHMAGSHVDAAGFAAGYDRGMAKYFPDDDPEAPPPMAPGWDDKDLGPWTGGVAPAAGEPARGTQGEVGLAAVIASLIEEHCWASADFEVCGAGDAAMAILAALRPPAGDAAGGVPEGYVVVPREPTEEMVAAGWIDKEDVDPDDIYRAMIAAAPEGASADEVR